MKIPLIEWYDGRNAMRKPLLHYYSHRGRRKHPTTVLHRLGTGVGLPLLLIVLATFLTTGALLIPAAYTLRFELLIGAVGATLVRLLISYALCLVIGVALGLLAEKNKTVESFLLPIYDVLESIPVIAFFPVIILFFVRSNFLEGAAIFMLFFAMIWSVVFNTIGGLKVIPQDVKAVGYVFGFSKWERFTKITLPALFPPLVTGSILALAAGWNLVIVAEGLHAYAPQSARAHDLFGIGSVLVQAALQGDNATLLAAMAVLILVIAVINIFVWQPLLARAEHYKFE
jgi:NitT/TauT family transport system permease protein